MPLDGDRDLDPDYWRRVADWIETNCRWADALCGAKTGHSKKPHDHGHREQIFGWKKLQRNACLSCRSVRDGATQRPPYPLYRRAQGKVRQQIYVIHSNSD